MRSGHQVAPEPAFEGERRAACDCDTRPPSPRVMSTSSSDSDEPELSNTLRSHKAAVNCVAYSPCDEQLVSGADDGSLIFWNLNGERPNETGLCYRLSGHKSAVNSVDYASTGQFFVSASRDTTVRLWKLNPSISKPDEEPVVYKCHGLVSRCLFAATCVDLLSFCFR